MKILISKGRQSSNVGGDFLVFKSLQRGLGELGVDAEISDSLDDVNNSDHVVLTNTCINQIDNYKKVLASGKPYSVLPFHEDVLKWQGPAESFTRLVFKIIENDADEFGVGLEMLRRNPEIIFYSLGRTPFRALVNRPVLEGARKVFPNTKIEASTILRDAPNSKVFVLPLPLDFDSKFSVTTCESFAEYFGLAPGYALQVGRFEPRKNQLATIIALSDVPVPLVFLATKGYNKKYEEMALKAIVKYRKYPTYVIGESFEDLDDGALHVRSAPNQLMISDAMLGSAYSSAGVNVHPAFYELPGLTYLEAAYFNVPSIYSLNSSVSEYLLDGERGGFYSVLPYDLSSIKNSVLAAIFGKKVFVSPFLRTSEKQYASGYLREILVE